MTPFSPDQIALITRTLRDAKGNVQINDRAREQIAFRLHNALQAKTPGFDSKGFIDACGVTLDADEDESALDAIKAQIEAITKAGAQACRDGVKWWNNPHPSGSVAAKAWDNGHTTARPSASASEGDQ